MPNLPKEDKKRWITYQLPFERAERSDIYTTPRWKDLRDLKLRTTPVCEQCEKEGHTKRAEQVDHIIAIKDGGDPWSYNNLQSLCREHHLKKTAKEIHRRRSSTATTKTE